MPPAKRAAQKAATQFADAPGRDLRRAFEHSGRVEILQRLLPFSATESIATLIASACTRLESGRSREAACLLRASEHLSFAALASGDPDDVPLSADLEEAIQAQIEELARRGEPGREDEAGPADPLGSILKGAREGAIRAFRNAAWQQALEFARAAEALAQVEGSMARADRKGPHQMDHSEAGLKLVSPR